MTRIRWTSPTTSVRSRRRLAAAAALIVTVVCAVLTAAAPADAKSPADPTLTDRYTAVGSSHIGSVNATLPISKTKLVETLDLDNFKIVSGTLPIAPQVVSFTALGFIPLRATVTLVQVSPITGSITPTDNGNVLQTTVNYTIKLTNIDVHVFGTWVSLGVGNNCQTVKPVTISAGSPAGKYFDITAGGTVTGKYTIGNFQNCAPLNLPDIFGVGSLAVNALVPGTNNTLTVTLSDGTFVGST